MRWAIAAICLSRTRALTPVPTPARPSCAPRATTPSATAAADAADVYGRMPRLRDDDGADAASAEPVVKVYSVHYSPNPHMPWANKAQEESTGSGFTIAHGGDDQLAILTNAHVVADATYIEVRKAGDARKYVARRIKHSHECDLAMLTVDDAQFWRGVEPLAFGSMPLLQDEVSVVGYPEGGEGVSITQGVVSRIEIQRYAHSGSHLLAIQIDAAINPGNSGGPAINEEGEVIGVAFQNQYESQNIGYVIPVPTIEHFLHDALHDEQQLAPAGFPSLGIYWQALENEQLRRFLGMGSRTGVLIRGVVPTAPSASLLRRDDVLLRIDGREIANDGTFSVGEQERLSFAHLIHLKYEGERISLCLLRDGEELEIAVPVRPLPRLVPTTLYDEPQPYFMYAGLVFVPLSEPYLHEWGDDWQLDAPHELVNMVIAGIQTQKDEHPVILSRAFPSKQTAGYLTLNDRRVLSVNGQPVHNLRQMYELVSSLHESADFLDFELQCVGGSIRLAIETSQAEETGRHVMQTYRIPSMSSPDLR